MALMNRAALRARDTLWLAVAGATVAGAVHVGWFLVRSDVLGRFVGAPRELPWLSPMAYFAYYALLAIPLMLLAKLLPALARPAVQGTVLGTATCLGVLLNITKLHPAAVFVLAIGSGVQFGRLLERDPARGMRLVRRTAAVLAGALFAVGIPEIVVYRLAQRSKVEALAAAPPDSPNVILLVLDAVRAANLSVYGYARPTTPTLERFAAEGALFETAISAAPWTAPSHATLLTGRYPFHNGISYVDPMADSVPTVTEVFRAHGYATGAFMGNANWAGRRTGFDRAFIRYDDYPLNLWQALWSATFTQLDITSNALSAIRAGQLWRLPAVVRRSSFRVLGENYSERNTADVIVNNFDKWVVGIGHRPFFAMLNLWDAHDPYRSPNPSRFNEGRTDLDKYDASIAFADSMIGVMAQRLAARGELDRTIFVVTADHGEQFGEHGLAGHGNSLYLELLRVPLLIRAPGRAPAGHRVNRVVSLRDVPATMLQLAGLADPRITGTSLAGLWQDTASTARSSALSEVAHPNNRVARWPTTYGPMKSLVTDDAHYIRRGDGQERVYAWKGDTTGHGDLTSTDAGARDIREARDTIAHLLGPNWTRRAPTEKRVP